MGDHPWVDVAWDHIAPGDRVLHSDGTEFHATAKVDLTPNDYPSFQLARVDGDDATEDLWTDRPRGERVQGWRFSDSPAIPGAEAFAIGRLRLAGFDVNVIEEK